MGGGTEEEEEEVLVVLVARRDGASRDEMWCKKVLFERRVCVCVCVCVGMSCVSVPARADAYMIYTADTATPAEER